MVDTVSVVIAAAETLTLQESAEALGVHYMTVYRYVRLGLLDATKAKGSWHVTAEALEAFRNGAGHGPVDAGVAAPWSERLESRLVSGDGQGAWNVVESSMTSGMDPRGVYLEMLVPAMRRIGGKWAVGDLDIAVEHQATVIAMRIIGRLGPRFTRRGRPRGELILGAPAGEPHGLSTAILSDLMRLHGWNVNDLGANTPTGSFLHALRAVPETRAVGISMSQPSALRAVGECCAAIKSEFPMVLVVIGGQGLQDEQQALACGADARAVTADHFHEMLLLPDTGDRIKA
jgi:MerR family transcriptional regulator, light-induced transcriptional regulator